MDVGGEIKLAVGSDFIAPALACTKPKQIEAADQSKATPGPTKHVLRIEGSDESMKPTSASVARITLNDCLACSGCVTSAETMLISQQSAEEFLRGSAHATLTLISISPAARAAIAADTGLSVRDAFSRLTSFFKGLGCDRVLDCGLASDLSLLQNAAEFVQRFKLKQPATEERLQPPPVLESVLESASVGPLPLVSSSCPGWVCYAEKTQGAVLAHLSTAKSPQQVAGTLLKRVYGASLNVPPDRIYHATVMPCYDKKLEASRDDFVDDSAGATGARDVDCVLSSSEVIELLKSRGLTPPPGAPTTAPPPSPLPTTTARYRPVSLTTARYRPHSPAYPPLPLPCPPFTPPLPPLTPPLPAQPPPLLPTTPQVSRSQTLPPPISMQTPHSPRCARLAPSRTRRPGPPAGAPSTFSATRPTSSSASNSHRGLSNGSRVGMRT